MPQILLNARFFVNYKIVKNFDARTYKNIEIPKKNNNKNKITKFPLPIKYKVYRIFEI